MSRLRHVALACLGASGLLVAMAAVPSAASAQDDISIVSAGADSGGNPYDLTVVANDGNGVELTSMTVSLSGPINYTITDMQPADDESDPSSQAWAPSSPIPTTALPAGTYTITVTAVDKDETDGGLSAGTIQYTDSATSISVTPSQSNVTEGSQSVTFQGTVTGTASYDGTTGVPIAGATVNVSSDVSGQITSLTTGSDGSFSYEADGITATTNFDFSVQAAGDGSYPAQDSGDIPITAEQASPTTVQVNADPVYSGGTESVTFTGSVSAISPLTSGTVPVTGVPVSLTTDGGSNSLGNVTSTDSSGDFTYTANDVTSSTDYDFSVPGNGVYAAGNDDVSLSTASTSVSVSTDPNPAQVTQGTGGPNTVTFTGTVQITPPGGTATSIGSGVDVNLSVNGGPVQDDVATTNDAGTFTYGPVSGISADTTYDFTVSGSGVYGDGDSGPIQVTAEPGQTQIAVSPSSASVTEGSSPVPITATVTVVPPNTMAPGINIGAGIPVDVNGTSIGTTNSAGQITYDAPVQGGSYTFTVPSPNPSDASDALYSSASPQEVTVSATPATTSIAITTPPQVITFGNPSTFIDGSVTALQTVPGGTTVPVTGAALHVNGNDTSTTTASDGSFSYTTPDLTTSTDYDFTVPADGGDLYSAGDSGEVPVEVAAGQTQLTVTAMPTGPNTVTFASAVQVEPAGGSSYESGGANIPIDLSVNGGTASQQGMTGSDGTYTETISDVTPGATYAFSVPNTNALYEGATQDVSLNKETTSMQVTPSQTSVTEGSQNVTFAGTVQITPIGSTTAQSIGAGVNVYLNGGTTPIATTNSAGQFSYSASGISAATKYAFTVAATSTYTEGLQSVPISVNPAETRITGVVLSPSKVKYGQKTTLKATVQYQNASAKWTALPGTSVQIAEGKTTISTVKASANGTFSATLPSTHGFGWSATVNGAALTAEAQRVGNLVISVPLRVKSFGASLGVNGRVSLTGCLQVTVPVNYGPITPVTVQYSSNGRNHWKTLGKLALHNLDHTVKACPNATESYFSGSIASKLANAYYRADFPTNNSFQGAVSGVIHAWRYQTKITGYAISPHTVSKGQDFSITGRLWWHGRKGWVPYAHETVYFVYNQKGTSFWGKLGSSKTNAKGYFHEVGQGYPANFVVIMYAEYQGNKLNLATRSPGITVTNKASSVDFFNGGLSVQLTPSTTQKARIAREEYLIVDTASTRLPVL